ncbi:DNA repair protein rad9 [Nitzschia inconspicua]|uniref:DNA repair protein rad9 n=1 Tax=Nitzschia inconspicua TaxID=303405 RepID=A0A9K3PI39_9STRA|nr:DNA repair protein rad9 [Nitzschia inconspicua]
MDCIIPGHSIKPFCASIGCLSRIGKDLYIDFDPIGGLRIRALNDSKSVFGNFHYEPAFFTRCASISKPPTSRKRKKKKNASQEEEEEEEDDDDEYSEQWTVCIAMKSLAAVVRARKDVLQLHMLTVGDHLAFEFQVERMDSNGTVKVTHKVGYSPAGAMAAVAHTDGASELMVQPNVLSTMLEPLKRSSEIAILINDHRRMISSVTFQHDDLPEEGPTSLSMRTKQASLKTETSVSYDELVDVHYVGHADDVSASMTQGIPPPSDMKEQMVLVFSLKEFKAFLQYCSHAFVDQELQASIQFFWGGKPMVVKTMGENFNAELIMATLDHQLLRSDIMKVSPSSAPPTETNSSVIALGPATAVRTSS